MKKDLEDLLEKWINIFNTWHKKSMAMGQKITFFLNLYDKLPYKPLVESKDFRCLITEHMNVEALTILDGIHHFHTKLMEKSRYG